VGDWWAEQPIKGQSLLLIPFLYLQS
jgi:hypothetical protein